MRDYYVVEQNVPTGYTVTTVQEGTTFVVTNTYTPPASPTPPDTPGNTPTNTPPGTPNSNTKLPQTGQLWWPVTIMALLGLTLFVLGWGIHRRGGHK
jgi:hypothetical protein